MFRECAFMWKLWIRLEHILQIFNLPHVQLKSSLFHRFTSKLPPFRGETVKQGTFHSDELESQESLLGEGDETPRFDVDTLDQIGAPAKRAVEESYVSPSAPAGELGLDSQGLLAEKSETPRFCSVYLRGTAPKCLLGFIMFWVSGMSITIFVLKLNWHIILRI